MIASLLFWAVAGHSEVIESAKAKMSSGQRAEAIKLLIDEIIALKVKREKVPEGRIQSLRVMAKSFSETFLSEDGQKYYELAEASEADNWKQAQGWLEKSLAAEKSSVEVARALARLYLRTGNCSAALEAATRALKVFPIDASSYVLSWQAQECLGRGQDVFSEMTSQTMEDLNWQPNPLLKIYWARKAIREGRVREGQLQLAAISTQFKDLPEAWYWRWKLDPKDGQLRPDFAVRYLNLCQSMSSRLNQKLKQYGGICLYQELVKKHEVIE